MDTTFHCSILPTTSCVLSTPLFSRILPISNSLFCLANETLVKDYEGL